MSNLRKISAVVLVTLLLVACGGSGSDGGSAGTGDTSIDSISNGFAGVALNDTGIYWGGNYPNSNNTSCIGETIEQQDCTHGQTVFNLTKIDSNGVDLPSSATNWSCVRDDVTGLIWEVKKGSGIHNANIGYLWGGKTALLNGDYGTRYDNWNGLVDGSNSEQLCGYSDWRVPTIKELLSIVDSSGITPTVNSGYFPSTSYSINPAVWYWSSTPSPNHIDRAMSLDFQYASTASQNRSDAGRIRLVRSGSPANLTDSATHCSDSALIPSTPDSQFIDNMDGTVTDATTGLMWKQCSEGQASVSSSCVGSVATLTWQAALQVPGTLNTTGGFGGHTDWRLPNKNELYSLIETCRFEPSINLTYFPGTPALTDSTYHTSSPDIFEWNGNSYVWTVRFYDANTWALPRGNSRPIRMVRSVQ